MSRLLFDSPLLLGFDHLEQMMDRLNKSAGSGYPPYNIEQLSERHLRITLAVAGFSMNDLDVAMEDRKLVIRGKIKEDEDEQEERFFLHRGIAARQFQRAFILSDEIQVKGAHLDNGLLHIDLTRIIPEKTIQTIQIQPSAAKKNRTMAIDTTVQTDEK
jgi:HSP20 family molecular chaperone IbpA